MGLHQFARNKYIWTLCNIFSKQSPIQPLHNGIRMSCCNNGKLHVSKDAFIRSTIPLVDSTIHVFPVHKTFIDLFTNNKHKEKYVPTINVNRLKVYEDLELPKLISDPLINNIKITDKPLPSLPEKKEAVTMLRIRRRKMKKHKLRKLRKRMKFVFAKMKMKKELRKEQEFRRELLTQVEAADKFDAKEYVQNILNTIRYQPKPETEEERIERYRQLKKMNRFNTSFIRPKFD